MSHETGLRATWRSEARELIVPAIMLAGIAAFAWDSRRLSFEALLLPAALIVTIVLALVWSFAGTFLLARLVRSSDPHPDSDAIGAVREPRAWMLIAVPAVVMLGFDWIGAVAGLVLLLVLAQFVFGFRKPLQVALVSLAVAIPTYALFKYVLYVRFPPGVLGIG